MKSAFFIHLEIISHGALALRAMRKKRQQRKVNFEEETGVCFATTVLVSARKVNFSPVQSSPPPLSRSLRMWSRHFSLQIGEVFALCSIPSAKRTNGMMVAAYPHDATFLRSLNHE
jgi:hypothetical protein